MEIGKKKKNNVSSLHEESLIPKDYGPLVFFFFFFLLSMHPFSYHLTLKLDTMIDIQGVDCLFTGHPYLHVITITSIF
jgi:hypothetical protein